MLAVLDEGQAGGADNNLPICPGCSTSQKLTFRTPFLPPTTACHGLPPDCKKRTSACTPLRPSEQSDS